MLDGDRAPEWVRLFPDGPDLQARDGRKWRLDDPEAVARRSEERRGGTDLAVDWEHAQDKRAPMGHEAPAAGWITAVAAREGRVMARIEWTERGRASVESREYRYISPSFGHTIRIGPRGNLDGGEITYIAGAGLVNRPAFDMPALAGEEASMDKILKKILEALGLASDATGEQAAAAVAALKTERDEARSQAASPPIESFVPRADYDNALARATAAETELASVRSAGLDAEIKAALDAAQEAGRITPATRSYYEAQCRTEGGLGRFREFAADAPETGGPSGITGSPPGTAGGFASPEERAIAGLFRRDAKFLDEHAPRSQGVS